MNSIVIAYIITILQVVFAPPVTQKKDGEESEINALEDYMEYHRYLKEVVNALESDPDFRQKLEKADENDIRSGKIAEQLEFVSHHVRTKLDEIKRVELERLKELMNKKRKLENPNALDTEDPTHHHLDHGNPHSFEIEDLKKLIAKTTADLAEVDKKRKEQFKQYEMEKEYKRQDKLNHTNGSQREELENEYKEMEEKHKKHVKLHEPGHKAQLEEVWQEQDQMQQEFNPKTFFMLHDLDGNGLWDQDEVKSLFVKELEKMYEQGHPEDDMREKAEEMERMRESVFREMDTNQDGFIDYNEFLRQTNTNDFKQDNGWQGLDEQKVFSPEELEEYIRQHHLEQAAAYGQGQYQHIPPGGYQVPQYQQVPPGYQQVPPGAYQQVYNGGYQQVPSGFQGVPPHPGQNHQGYQNQIPQGGYHQEQNMHGQGQQIQGGYQQAQIPPGAIQQNAQQHHPELNTNEIYPQGYQQQPPHLQQNIPQINNQPHQQQIYNPNQQQNQQAPNQHNSRNQQQAPNQPYNQQINNQHVPNQQVSSQQGNRQIYNEQPKQQVPSQQGNQQIYNEQPKQQVPSQQGNQQIYNEQPKQVPNQQQNQQAPNQQQSQLS